MANSLYAYWLAVRDWEMEEAKSWHSKASKACRRYKQKYHRAAKRNQKQAWRIYFKRVSTQNSSRNAN